MHPAFFGYMLNTIVSQALSGKISIRNFVQCIKYKKQFRADHPEYFDPDGIMVFCGPQGSGKTLSAVAYVIKLAQQYPQMILCTNVSIDKSKLNGIKVYPYTGLHDLSKYCNGYAGVVFLIDEIQIEFNSLESKNIDPAVIQEIAQQRKQRKHIVGTSQVFNRIAKPFREQFKYAVMCRNFFGYIQYNGVVRGDECTVDEDGKVSTEHVRHFLWVHSADLYRSYDTYAKIIRTNSVGYDGGIVPHGTKRRE